MAQITLNEPWAYRTPMKTIQYPAGSHRVLAEIHEAALADGVIEEKPDGDSGSNARSQGDTDAPES